MTTTQPQETIRQLHDRLPAILRSALGDVTAVHDLVRLSGGASRETWAFDAVDSGGERRSLILQRRRALALKGDLSTSTEVALLTAAASAGVPVPAVVAFSDDPAEIGAPYLVVERLAGETIPQRILREDCYAAARTTLAEQYGHALGRIHTIAPAKVPGLEVQDPVEYQADALHKIGHPHPALELGLRWLRANDPRETSASPAVLHGDFRNGNGVVGTDGLHAVIDWELAHLGDPMEDLGWFCIRAWRFGAQLPAGGFGTYEQFFDGYERASGRRPGRDEIRWWQVLGSLRWAVICITQGATHLTGVRRSLELAAVGRRAAEAEFDMLLLMP